MALPSLSFWEYREGAPQPFLCLCGSFQAEQRGAVFVDNSPERGLVGDQRSKCGERPASDAVAVLSPGSHPVVAITIASPDQLARVPANEAARKLSVPGEGIQAGVRRKVSVDVGVVSEQPVRQPAALDRALGVEIAGIKVGADISPPGLRVPDKVDPGVPLKNRFEALEPGVVSLVLEVNEHRHD